MARCKLCGKKLSLITNTHFAAVHDISIKRYIKKFGAKNCGFLSPNLLPKTDPRYQKWRQSLMSKSAPWNKGQTKETSAGVAKISRTFKKKRIDNFADWREKMRRMGVLPAKNLPSLKRSGDFAELLGVILGDGCLQKFPRTERLSIFSNKANQGFIKRYTSLAGNVLGKVPTNDRHGANCVNINIYQKDISKRLGIPVGARRDIVLHAPRWILTNDEFLVRFLRGLYEAEGSFCIHKPTYTYKFLFGNRNKSLLRIVFRGLKKLGFHPHTSKDQVQISRKEEAYSAKKLLNFRQY